MTYYYYYFLAKFQTIPLPLKKNLHDFYGSIKIWISNCKLSFLMIHNFVHLPSFFSSFWMNFLWKIWKTFQIFFSHGLMYFLYINICNTKAAWKIFEWFFAAFNNLSCKLHFAVHWPINVSIFFVWIVWEFRQLWYVLDF